MLLRVVEHPAITLVEFLPMILSIRKKIYIEANNRTTISLWRRLVSRLSGPREQLYR